MVDTTSPLLGLLLMGTGGDNNSWGINLNSQVITLIENAIAGRTDITGLTGGSLVLTADQSRSRNIVLFGTLTSDLIVTVPASFKNTSFYNACTGAFVVLLTAAGSSVQVNLPSGRFVDIHSSPTGAQRMDQQTVGELFYYAGTAAPAGSLACNGAIIKRASYPDLFGKIGTTWGIGDNVTTFGLPNSQDTGRFLRSSGGGLAVGTYQASQNKAHTHTGSGTTSGISQAHTHTGSGSTSAMNQNAVHSHTYTAPTSTTTSAQVVAGASAFFWSATTTGTTNPTNIDHVHTYSFTTSGDSVDHTHTYSFTTSGGSADGAEARPESLVGLLCIRY